MKWLLLLSLAGCSPLVCAERLRIVQIGKNVSVQCGKEWTRQYHCTSASIVVRGNQSQLLCDGYTLAIMPGDVTEVAP